jgi:hypothetical protein
MDGEGDAITMNVLTCREWGSSTLDNESSRDHHAARGAVVHHTAGANRQVDAGERDAAIRLMRQIQRQHIDRNRWRDIGYNFVVTRSGIICEGRCGSYEQAQRGRVLRGAHAGELHANRYWFGVALEGNYSYGPPPGEQWDALIDILAHLAWWGDYQTQNLRPHRHYKSTECPGEAIIRRFQRLQTETHNRKVQLIATAPADRSPNG